MPLRQYVCSSSSLQTPSKLPSSPAPAWLAAEKWPSTRDGGEYRAISEERWKSSSSLAGCREMAKYQGWRGVPRAISEERWKKECSRRGTGGAGQGRAGWLQLQLQVPEKNKEKVERYPERRSSQTRVATTCLADKTNHPVERLSLNRSQCGSCSTKYDTSAGT